MCGICLQATVHCLLFMNTTSEVENLAYFLRGSQSWVLPLLTVQ